MIKVIVPITLLLLLIQASWAQESHTQARSFVKEAVMTRLSDSTLSKTTLSKILAKDSSGHALSFIPDCPICLGVQDALLSLTPGEEDRGVPTELSADKASTRTSFLARLVRESVQLRLDTIEGVSERLEMAEKLTAASQEGQRQLARYQARKVDTYKMMWSCLMCDAAEKAGKGR